MRYWLNIHHPVQVERPRHDWNQIYLKEMHRNTALPRMSPEDIGVIYEKDWKEGQRTKEGYALQQGRRGIVAILRLSKLVNDHHDFDGSQYEWRFDAETIWGGFIPLEEIRRAWRNQPRQFNPRINGGLRELNIDEWQIIASLARQQVLVFLS